jgi:hypothetical protein
MGLVFQIRAVDFADFGTPTGSCATGFAVNTSCTAPASNPSGPIVAKACLGKQTCTLQANVDVFGSQCFKVPKRLAVNITCTSSPGPPPLPIGPRHFEWNVTIPHSTDTASIKVPLLGADVGNVTITVDAEAGSLARAVIWQHGQFVAGAAAGVVGAVAGDDGVELTCRSGRFAFVVADAAATPTTSH